MPTIDFATLTGVLADLGVNLLSYAAVASFIYAIGGILIRTISWTLDQLIISYIAKFYDYFEIILKGEILSKSAISTMLNGVYLLVGVFVLFRLAMLLIRYILNPEQVNDEKAGVSKLALLFTVYRADTTQYHAIMCLLAKHDGRLYRYQLY